MSQDSGHAAIREMVRRLSGEIGVRLGGSPEEAQAAEFVAQQFEECGLHVKLQAFKFLGWQCIEDPVVEVISPTTDALEASPMAYTGSTPGRRVEGALKRVGTFYPVPGHRFFEFPKYAIVDERGVEAAYLVCRAEGGPIPFPNVLPVFTAICVMLGEEAHRKFERWMAEGQEIRVSVSVKGEYVPDSTSQNVVATLEGEIDEAIVVGAHHDSAYRSPGANDDASGVAALCQLARQISNAHLRRTIRFVSFGSEEFTFVGSGFYVNDQKERGGLSRIKAFIGLDTVGAGSPMGIRVHPKALESKLSDMWRTSKLAHRVKVEFGTPLPCSDDWPFHAQGIPSATFTFLDFPEYHQPLDTEDRVDPELVLGVTQLVHRLVRSLDEAT